MHATSDELSYKLRPVLVQLEKTLGYTGAKVGSDYGAFLEAMYLQADGMRIPYPEGSHAWHSLQAGANYAYFCYRALPLEVRIFGGIYTWLAILVDDLSNRDPEEWHQFVPRFFAGARQHGAVAQAWDGWLRTAYQHYPPTAANFIVTASLNFTNACALEGSAVAKMTRTAGGQNWAYYIRDKTGVAEAYAWMTFPRSICPEPSLYVEAIEDMNRYLCYVNDVYSFYKEELAAETDTYMHLRASYEGVGAFEMLKQVVKEVEDIDRRIALVLEGKTLYAQLWKDQALGYLSFHKTSTRYKLCDLGLEEKLP
ncbi:isoprenoid synthase domain-containing protein [Xylaria palmicola]|nr:isoprenoid synthase domain-containing protein [Xylaria palmicola]